MDAVWIILGFGAIIGLLVALMIRSSYRKNPGYWVTQEPPAGKRGDVFHDTVKYQPYMTHHKN
jgi:hypothetical protein